MALGGVCAFAGDPVGPLPRAIATSALTTRNVGKTSIRDVRLLAAIVQAGSKPVKLIGCHPRASRIPPAHWRSGRDERARGR
jgi:hypothetical protein